jgi:hypothetical protein
MHTLLSTVWHMTNQGTRHPTMQEVHGCQLFTDFCRQLLMRSCRRDHLSLHASSPQHSGGFMDSHPIPRVSGRLAGVAALIVVMAREVALQTSTAKLLTPSLLPAWVAAIYKPRAPCLFLRQGRPVRFNDILDRWRPRFYPLAIPILKRSRVRLDRQGEPHREPAAWVAVRIFHDPDESLTPQPVSLASPFQEQVTQLQR